MGDTEGAHQDFKCCIERSRDPRVRADCYMERGSMYQKNRDYRKAEAELHVRSCCCAAARCDAERISAKACHRQSLSSMTRLASAAPVEAILSIVRS